MSYVLFENEDDYQKIIDSYAKIADSSDLPPEFNTVLAVVYAKTGKIDESLAYCRKALTINTEDIRAYRILGLIQFLKKDLVGAKKQFINSIESSAG